MHFVVGTVQGIIIFLRPIFKLTQRFGLIYMDFSVINFWVLISLSYSHFKKQKLKNY